ncbi:predicted protein [Aspergillus nidulans FGSC A4]|uniref:Transcription factor IIIC 90kDa subunit N-terminal domain-containing protein n=1 Tax=Emericella nidulans (strain FGSC A4 / ATCC 38163 / CBS 112.46 / NRRL 194 / M139) TaxID=227321 RepID=Q5B285_EMENI|nr:hypothetical protein [Aspergillus nidulans FGSC A4]EAA62505.1 predicted protein [Aspergillus nidulans FGSC A4]CBF82064.1 TPA: conserved hypothetical protein [Aspergillus nidulans FGSC A4]|eukprot:XP_662949.1 predicted protein [Aspergillus nidulans FGSC A4]
MLDPIELQVFPSSYDCISWSEDGDIAVAAGEYVHILTPKLSSENEANGTSPNASSIEWHRIRFRANVFTINEWPIMFPQPRDHFSVGAEQSFSTVAGIGWSPPGLAKYRRSVLAVLTSNMVLTIYAPTNNPAKWTRIAIVNKSLEIFFHESIENGTPNLRTQSFRRDIEDNTARTRKTNIRSFTWLPPLKVPAKNELYPAPESRWGFFLLAVTNEDNDMVILQVQPSSSEQASQYPLRVNLVSTVSLPTSAGFGPALQFNSLLAKAVRSQVRSLYLSSGPWLYQTEKGDRSGEFPIVATTNVATIQGVNLRVVRLSVNLELRNPDSHDEPRYNLTFNASENVAIPVGRTDLAFTGPIRWAQHAGTGRVSMAVGARAKLAWIDIPESVYIEQDSEDNSTQFYGFPMMVESSDGVSSTSRALHERISGMTVTTGVEPRTPTLHLGSVGGYAAVMPLAASAELSIAPWNAEVEDIRERFDIDRDLGGLAIARIWGLVSQQELIAAAVTLHPGDMVEYRTNAEDRLTVVLSTATGQPVDPERYILRNHTGTESALSPKVLYAAACCAIVQSQRAELIASAREVLKKLSASTGVHLSDEIARCSEPGSAIEAKPPETLNAPGGNIFEKFSEARPANDPKSAVQFDVSGNPRAWNLKALLQM